MTTTAPRGVLHGARYYEYQVSANTQQVIENRLRVMGITRRPSNPELVQACAQVLDELLSRQIPVEHMIAESAATPQAQEAESLPRRATISPPQETEESRVRTGLMVDRELVRQTVFRAGQERRWCGAERRVLRALGINDEPFGPAETGRITFAQVEQTALRIARDNAVTTIARGYLRQLRVAAEETQQAFIAQNEAIRNENQGELPADSDLQISADEVRRWVRAATFRWNWCGVAINALEELGIDWNRASTEPIPFRRVAEVAYHHGAANDRMDQVNQLLNDMRSAANAGRLAPLEGTYPSRPRA
jgi:hypothetical protein